MKTFLLSPSMNGYSITDDAAMYLDWIWLRHAINDVDAEEYFEQLADLKKGYRPDIDDFEVFKTHVKKEEDRDRYVWDGKDGWLCLAMTNKHKADFSQRRDELIPLVRLLHYDYAELDKLNNGTELRLIDVPDDAPVYIDYETEFFTEHLSMKTPLYTYPNDRADRARYLINTFVNDVWNHTTGTFEFKGITFILNDHYGIAKYVDKHAENYILLRKVTYYNKKPTFEIVELKDGQEVSAFTHKITYFMLDKDMMDSFAQMYAKMSDEKK